MKKIIQSKWTIRIKTPTVPNFFLEYTNDRDEFGKYPICDFDDDVLRQVGEAWTENLLERAKTMRRNRGIDEKSSVPSGN